MIDCSFGTCILRNLPHVCNFSEDVTCFEVVVCGKCNVIFVFSLSFFSPSGFMSLEEFVEFMEDVNFLNVRSCLYSSFLSIVCNIKIVEC